MEEIEETSDKARQKAWDGDYIFYNGLTEKPGELYHIIYYVKRDGREIYLINDETGEIRED